MSELTKWAQEGYDAAEGTQTDYTEGSNADIAWRVGHWLKTKGADRPNEVTPESGYSIRVDGVKIVLTAAGYGEPRIVES